MNLLKNILLLTLFSVSGAQAQSYVDFAIKPTTNGKAADIWVRATDNGKAADEWWYVAGQCSGVSDAVWVRFTDNGKAADKWVRFTNNVKAADKIVCFTDFDELDDDLRNSIFY